MPNSNSASERVFVVGGSAGSIEALQELLGLLPENFSAPILVVVHISTDSPGGIPNVLGRRSPLPVQNAIDGAPPQPGNVYLAPPGFHLQLEPGRMCLTGGPKENRHRPAIDPLFRSAAAAYGPAAVGIVLSGYLDDGSAGLFRIKQAGGIAVIQDPDNAMVPDMPRNASAPVKPDFAVSIREMAPLMAELAGERIEAARAVAVTEASSFNGESPGTPSVFSCPESHGTLRAVENGGTPDTMLEDQTSDVERALWAALRSLEENTELSHSLAHRSRQQGFPHSEHRYLERAQESYMNAKVLRTLLTGGRQVPAPARSMEDLDEEIS